MGDKIVYTITIKNIGNVNLSGLTISDTLTDGDGNSLGLTTSPTFVSATANSTSATIVVNGVLTYTAEFIIDQQSIDSGSVNNSVLVTASSPGNTNDVSDVSDDGNDSDGNIINDPTVIFTRFQPNVEVTKTASTTDNNLSLIHIS